MNHHHHNHHNKHKFFTIHYFYITRIASFICFIIGLEIVIFGGLGEVGDTLHFSGIERAIAFTPFVFGYIFGIISNEIKHHLHK